MKYCTKCGTQMPDESKFCTKCGSRLSREPVESPAKSKKPMLVGVCAVLVVAVVALVIVLSKGKGSGNPDIAASSSNVSTEKESGGTEKLGGFLTSAAIRNGRKSIQSVWMHIWSIMRSMKKMGIRFMVGFC